MSKIKQMLFYLGNAVIGIVSCYVYLYLWMVFSWSDQFRFISIETFISLFFNFSIFLAFNYLLLRKETTTKNHWWYALAVMAVSIAAFVLIIEYS